MFTELSLLREDPVWRRRVELGIFRGPLGSCEHLKLSPHTLLDVPKSASWIQVARDSNDSQVIALIALRCDWIDARLLRVITETTATTQLN